jgi:hypothetical protein
LPVSKPLSHFHSNVFGFVFIQVSTASTRLKKDHDSLNDDFRAEYLAFLVMYVNLLTGINRKNMSRRDRLAIDATIRREELRLKLKYQKLSAAINSQYKGILFPWELDKYSDMW